MCKRGIGRGIIDERIGREGGVEGRKDVCVREE